MMYKTQSSSIRKSIKSLICIFALISLIIQSCGVDGLSVVSQPPFANAGDVISINLQPLLTYDFYGDSGPKNLIVAFLVPKSWNAGSGNNTTMTYTSNLGNGKLFKIADSEKVPNASSPGLSYPDYLKKTYKAGNNLSDDHEWVVYKSDKQYTLTSGQKVSPIITIQTKVGPDNLLTKFAYCVTFSGAGADQGGGDNKVILSNDCFLVNKGKGELVDFCNKPLSGISPLKSSDKDFLTISFDNDLFNTSLSNSTEIYLCAKGYTVADSTNAIDRCGVTNKKIQLTPLTDSNKQFKLSIYPRDLFDIPDGQSLLKIEYVLQDKSGKQVGKSNTAIPFKYVFTPCN